MKYGTGRAGPGSGGTNVGAGQGVHKQMSS